MKVKPGTSKHIGTEKDYEFYKGTSGYNIETGKSIPNDGSWFIEWAIMEVELECGHKTTFKTSGIGADNLPCLICEG
jgi:hypothetical protein